MSDKKLTVLGMIAVVTAGLAVLQSRIGQRTGQAEFGSSPAGGGIEYRCGCLDRGRRPGRQPQDNAQ